MNAASKRVFRTYIILTLLYTLSSSFIWGVNTLFLLDAGLTNTQAFAANAFFTLGQVIFEVPTGVVADVKGRKTSFLIGAATLLLSTLLYLVLWNSGASFLTWAVASILIGLGFTFFSGATEAWLVDAMNFTKYKGDMESVFAKGQITGGVSMLLGSVAGGYIAQATNLGMPYIIRCVLLGLTFIVALLLMKDLGFTPDKGKSLKQQVSSTWHNSLEHGFKKPSIRWMMLSSPFLFGGGIYAFYAMQPYLLELYGDPEAYGIAGLAAAIVAGAQIAGGILVPLIRKQFSKRTSIILMSAILSIVTVFVMGATSSFTIAVIMLVIWGLSFSASAPVRQAYMNEQIPSKQRATVLSFDSLISSSGMAASQPLLGRAADVWSYSASYLIASAIQVVALPFILLARGTKPKADTIKKQ